MTDHLEGFSSFKAWVAQLQPDSLFLLMAAGFLGVIMAFLIPVSIDILSKVAAKYNSDIVFRLFRNNFIIRYFHHFVLINIAVMLVMRFIALDEIFTSLTVLIIMWCLLFSSMIITAIAGYLIYRLESIIGDESVPLRMLAEKVDENIRGIPSISKGYQIREFIEGIGDIVYYQIRHKNNRSAIDSLTEIGKMTIKIIRLKVHQPDKFNTLVLSPEILKFQAEQNIAAAAEACFKNPNYHLGVLIAYINQLDRCYIAAVEEDNTEISTFILRLLRSSLQQASTQEDNHLVVELIVRKITNCINITIRQGKNLDEDVVNWYLDTTVRKPHRGNGAFHIPYLDILDVNFVRVMQNVISSSSYDNFSGAINYMAKNFNFPDYQREKLWGYHYLLRAADFDRYLEINREERVQRRVRNLIESESQMYTIAQLNKWLEDFNSLKEIITANLKDEDNRKKAHKLEAEIRDNAIRHLKYTRLIRLSYVIGSLCTLNEKSDYIRYMREVASEASSEEEGINMVPQELQEVMNDYLIFHDLSTRHNIPGNGYRRYIITLVREFLNDNARKQFYLPFTNQEQLAPGQEALRQLISTTEQEINRDKQKEYKKMFDFLKTEAKQIDKMIARAQSNQSISPKIKENFEKIFLRGFNNRLILRNIFKQYLKSYKNHTNQKLAKLPNRAWGINELMVKAKLLGSAESLRRIASQYGENLADIENMTIFDNIAKQCRKSNTNNFDALLHRMGEPQDLLIISSYSGVNHFLAQRERFHRIRHLESDILKHKASKQEELTNIKGFAGYYDINRYPIPVFNFYYRGSGNILAILYKNKLGTLAQMPLVSAKETKLKYSKLNRDFLYFKLDDLAKNPGLVKQYCLDAPEWLTGEGDLSQQKEFLKQRMLITVLENLTFTPTKSDDKLGYIVNIDNTRRENNIIS